ncbi:MAG: TetR/AcrR family transcriptional regulator [Burkholderiaceae bacterium]|nr:TetR/AcrR family transcriptional regulator [Burkholderiaceae bacterium]
MAVNKVSADQRVPSVAEKRTEQIATAAVALFSERGYVPTTIEDISNEIGVGKGLIYRYFEDKRDVLLCALCAVLDKYKKEYALALLDTLGPVAALRRVLAINCALAQEHAKEVTLAYRSTKDLMPEQRHKIMAIESEIVAEIRECLEACIATGLMRPVNPKIMAYQFLMFGHTWALKQWALSDEFSVAQFVSEGEQLLIVPFLTASGRRKFDAAGKIANDAAARVAPKTSPRRSRSR